MASSSSDEVYSHGVSELAAQLAPDHPEYLLDKQFELPEWLYTVRENLVVWHDPSCVPDPKFSDLTEKGFWAKVSSASALKQACADRNGDPALTYRLADHPLTLLILLTTPPRDVLNITGLQPSELGNPAIRILNRVEHQTKLFAYGVAQTLVADINNARDAVGVDTGRLTTAIQSKISHREEMEHQYHQAAAAYKASPTPEAHLEVLAAMSRLRVARQVVEALVGARSSISTLGKSLGDNAAVLDKAMNNSTTFMGCPVEEYPDGEWWIDGTRVVRRAEVAAHVARGDGGVAAAAAAVASQGAVNYGEVAVAVVASQGAGGDGGVAVPVADDHME